MVINMKKEQFEEALTGIDGQYLWEAAQGCADKAVRGRSLHRVTAAAAAVIAAAILVVNAAAPVDLGFYLAAVFGDGYEMLDAMTSMPDNVAYRSSGDEIRLEMKGLVGDRQVVDVFVDVTVAAECGVPGEYYRPVLDISDTGFPWETNLAAYGTAARVLSTTRNEDGSTTYACMLSLHADDGVMASKYAVTCTGIAGWDADGSEYRTLVDGTWNMAFSLNYNDLTEVFTPGLEGMMTGVSWEALPGESGTGDIPEDIQMTSSVTVDEIRISPLSIGIYYSGTREERRFYADYVVEDIYLTMADGTVITRRDYIVDPDGVPVRLHAEDHTWEEISEDALADNYIALAGSGGGIRADEDRYSAHLIATFSAPLPVDEIVSVTVGGLEIPIG